jgi:hypothetical protein
MSEYSIKYSDPLKAPIPIAETTIDYSTSIGLIGRNAAGFGSVIAEDLLHLLENFAAPVRPGGAIEGQLWYDTADSGNKILKVYDNTDRGWIELGGVIRSPSPPDTARPGDLWVDTTYNQVKICNGDQNFTLVGPSFSSTYQTGSYPESILDTAGQPHLVIKNYLNGNVLTIISQERFRPASIISGFDLLVPGVNLTSATYDNTTPAFNGVASQASALQISIPNLQTIPADNFFRKDIPQILSQVITINNDGGIRIGSTSPTFTLGMDGRTAVITNSADLSDIQFRTFDNGSAKPVLTIAGQTQRVGINKVHPDQELDVLGNANISGTIAIGGIVSANNSVNIAGSVNVSNNISVSGTSTFVDTITVSSTTTNNIAIIPRTASTYDIGSIGKPFRRIYADVVGTGITSSFSGISYSATKLQTSSTFAITGHISASQVKFNGTQPVNLVATMNASAINGQITTSTVNGSFLIPITNPQNGNIYKTTKDTFLADVTPNLIKPGFIMSSGYINLALAGSVNGAPLGWLWCDGTSYSSTGVYSTLYTALMHSVGVGGNPPFGSTAPGSFNVPNIPPIIPSNSGNPSTYVVRYMIKY